MTAPSDSPVAIKDGQRQHPIAGAWRPVLVAVVRAFARGDYALAGGVDGVDPVPPDVAEQIRKYVTGYGATLLELPEQTWDTSVAQWYGTHWELLVDLWTAEEGRSDLVLHCDVRESDAGYRFTLDLVYVP